MEISPSHFYRTVFAVILAGMYGSDIHVSYRKAQYQWMALTVMGSITPDLLETDY